MKWFFGGAGGGWLQIKINAFNFFDIILPSCNDEIDDGNYFTHLPNEKNEA